MVTGACEMAPAPAAGDDVVVLHRQVFSRSRLTAWIYLVDKSVGGIFFYVQSL